MFEPLEHFTPCRRHESGPHARRIDQVGSAVEAHGQRINSQIAGNVATHHPYIWENPVSAGLSERAELFAWSSASLGMELDAPPPGLKP